MQSFKDAHVVTRNGQKILETMASELETMFKTKISAVQVKNTQQK